MNTFELRHFLSRFSTTETDVIVCAIDELPRKTLNKNKNYGFVINLSINADRGSHWIGLYIEKAHHTDRHIRHRNNQRKIRRNGFFMDSYAFEPKSWYLIDFIKRNCNHIEYIGQQIQQLHSTVCGMYAAYFIIHMSKGFRFNDFIAKFSKNLLINDLFIIKVYHYYLRN